MVLYQSRHDATEYGRLAQLVEHLLDVQEVTGSSPVPSTIQFVLEPDSLRKRVRVRFLFIGGSAEGLLGTVNEQRQGITMTVVSCLLLFFTTYDILGLVQQIGSYMWRRIIINTVRMILCGNVEDSRMNPSEKVGVVSVVFVSTEEEKIKNKLKKLQDKNPEKFYMEYVTPLDVDLTSLEHYPSIEISKNDLQ